jgi:hypothetical protein
MLCDLNIQLLERKTVMQNTMSPIAGSVCFIMWDVKTQNHIGDLSKQGKRNVKLPEKQGKGF